MRCWKQECQTTAGCMCGRSPIPGAPVVTYVPADGDHFNMTPGKIWYVTVPKDWVDVIAGTANG